jgi:HAD superfamily hydrolase (TIGR01490 family)
MQDKVFNLPSIAFFDVDETLIHSKSMFEFLKFYLSRTYSSSGKLRFRLYWRYFKALSAMGASRESINKRYYRIYAGESYQRLIELGQEWYLQASQDNGFYMHQTLKKLNELKQAGAKIVLVSGSFRPCLQPIAQYLGLDEIICAELEVKNGSLTGNMTQQAIGAHKFLLSQQLMKRFNVSPQNCYAFGDHISDLALLQSVGHPIVIKNCEQLFAWAKSENWEIIDGYTKEEI